MSREISFRYDLLRGGAYYARLRAVEDSGRVRMNDGDTIKMSFTGSFAPTARDADGNAAEIDWMQDEIQPVLLIDGAEYPLGVYMVSKTMPSHDGTRESVSVRAYDRSWRVKATNSESLLYFARGTNYLDAVEGLLTAAGIETVHRVPCAAVLSEDREDWEPGTSYLTIVNELLGEIGYEDLWFDLSGAAVLEPAAVPETDAIDHELDASDPDTRLLPGYTRDTNLFDAPNVFLCICANPDKAAAMSATAVNDNPQSPLSVQRRGRRICKTYQVNNIADQEALQAYADKLRNESLISAETISLTTGLLPGWGVGDLVSLHYGDLFAACLSRSWEMELRAGGRMTHTLEKVVYALD